MSMSINNVVITGRVAKEIKLTKTNNGKSVVNMSIAVDGRDAQGNDRVDFINVVLWNKNAEAAAANLTKGSLIAAQGMLHTRSYQSKTYFDKNQQPATMYVTELWVNSPLVYLESKATTNARRANTQAAAPQSNGFQQQAPQQNTGFQSNQNFGAQQQAPAQNNNFGAQAAAPQSNGFQQQAPQQNTGFQSNQNFGAQQQAPAQNNNFGAPNQNIDVQDDQLPF